jgi:hypothetical protein
VGPQPVFRISLHLIRIQHFRLNANPEVGFDDQKLKKFTAEKNVVDQKLLLL